jgi:hypothetical protein
MKLKTKCSPHTINGSMDDFSHDAAVAHALVIALNESRNVRLRQGRSIEEWVEGRADEILAEWGYPNTEYTADIGMADRKEVERGGG